MSIKYEASTKTFFLDGRGVTYAFCINHLGYAEHLYWGESISHDNLLYSPVRQPICQCSPPGMDEDVSYQFCEPEIVFFGSGDYREPTSLPVDESGNRTFDLLYAGHEILPQKPAIAGMPSLEGGETLVLHLQDALSSFGADLYYTVYDDCDVICRRIVYRNDGNSIITLRRAYSFAMALPGIEYDVLSLYGNWAKERHIQRTSLPHGVISIDSKQGMSSSALNPFVSLVRKNTTETSGTAIGISLVYSSSFALKVQGTSTGSTLVTGGVQDFDFSWELSPGDTFETPETVIAYSNEGLGGMSRAFHRAYRNHLINRRYVTASRPIVINSWEAVGCDFDLPKLKAFADAMEKSGVDTFVLDDGWFRKGVDFNTNLGDWKVNTNKLEGGLMPLIDYVHEKGMKFGLWFEPEMISEDSDLFRTHPDYAIGVPGRPRCYGRHQFVLDLTRQDVRDYIVNTINGILQSHPIDYVKWDFNRSITEFYSLGLPPHRQAEFSHRYALGLYDICERIVNGNPQIFFEGCASGGARFDPAMLAYFSQIWTSDDSDAEERTRIQYGTSIVYPLSSMSCHVSVCPNLLNTRITPFTTRGHIASLGATGYELDPTDLTTEEMALVKQQIIDYRETEQLILDGDLYRLANPFTENYFSFLVVSPDKKRGILIAYRRQDDPARDVKYIYPSGLEADAIYSIPELNIRATGITLMRAGIIPIFQPGDYQSVRYTLIAE